MKICIISKFPPIQGGISAKTFWMAKGLAEAGNEVHVVTNGNCVESEYFIDDAIPTMSPNPVVHFVMPDIPWHIPYSELYIPRLLDKAIETIGDNQIDLIDTNYLIPYGIVGYFLSKITGIPYILRHGGSDVAKFLQKGVFKHLLRDVILNAAAIITDHKNREIFETINPNIYLLPRYIPDETYFKPSFTPHEIPTFAYIGKINYYWRYKSLDKIAEIFAGIRAQHQLLFISQGKGFKDFSEFVLKCGLSTYEFRKFVHPGNMPRLLEGIDFLLCFVKDDPIKDFSNILCEALWSGVPVLTDEAMDISEYMEYIAITKRDQVIKLALNEFETVQGQVNHILDGWSGPSRYTNNLKYNFSRYINANLEIYSGV